MYSEYDIKAEGKNERQRKVLVNLDRVLDSSEGMEWNDSQQRPDLLGHYVVFDDNNRLQDFFGMFEEPPKHSQLHFPLIVKSDTKLLRQYCV